MLAQFNSSLKIKIEWADLDLFGHVNNVAFFKYIQSARINFCESIGLTSINEKNKPGFIVASSLCQFKKPLFYPDTVVVEVKVDWVKTTSFQLIYEIKNSRHELCATGTDVLVVFDYASRTKTALPQALRDLIERNRNL